MKYPHFITRHTRYWAAQLALFGWRVILKDRSKYDLERYRKIKPGVSGGLTRRFIKLWMLGKLRLSA